MKKLQLLVLVVALVSVSSLAKSQESLTPLTKKTSIATNPNFSKGKSQIAIEGLNFGWGYGRVIGSIGFRYGYFIADNNLLFINGEFSTYGPTYQRYKAGLNYRHYFNTKKIVPFAQIGANVGWENFYENKTSLFGEISLGGGATFQVRKFGFELGMQLNVWDKVNFRPTVGVTYTF